MAAPRNSNIRGTNVGRGRRVQETIDTSATDWQTVGKCAQPGADPEAWFAGFDYAGQLPDDTEDKTAAAKRLCRGCPVLERCALFAIENKLEHGVFGGMTPYRRARNAARLTEKAAS